MDGRTVRTRFPRILRRGGRTVTRPVPVMVESMAARGRGRGRSRGRSRGACTSSQHPTAGRQGGPTLHPGPHEKPGPHSIDELVICNIGDLGLETPKPKRMWHIPVGEPPLSPLECSAPLPEIIVDGQGEAARSTAPEPLAPSCSVPSLAIKSQKKARTAKTAPRRHLNILLVEQRAKKQASRYMLPDAPPKKQKRNTSPKRVPCPLLPEVPATPPPRIIQAWEKKRLPEPTCDQTRLASSPSRTTDDEVSHESRQILPYMFPPSTGITSSENIDPDAQIVEAEIEFVGFNTSSIDPLAERSTSSPQFDDYEFLGVPNDVDPGSDIEENLSQEPDEVGAGFTGYRQCSWLRTEDIPSNLLCLLDDMHTRDDYALREVASNPDMFNFDWSNDPDKFVGQQETFTGEAGPTFSVDGLSPLDVFQRIWDSEILDLIVRESNRYGRQLYEKANKFWSDVNADDIWVFFAILMLQSILILPVEREYWYPCIALLKVGDFNSIMGMKKFIRIKKNLHFVDNNILSTAADEDRKFKKIWPIINHLNNKFSSLYLPEQHIVIDESLLLWKGRLSFAQVITTKAARVGIKSYELCESRTGYLWKMLFYTGKSDKSQPAYDPANHDEPEEATPKIVYNLVRPLLNKGHTLVMDNFYNSPLLSRTLKSKKTDTMGTLRLKREFVPEALRNITKSNTRVGEVVNSQTEDITISVWHDASIVALISTFHKSEVGGEEKYGTHKHTPQVVLDYNMTMGGVDKKEQMLQAFPLERVRNMTWYKKLFRRLLNVSIYNAFVIYNHNKKGNQRQFRVALAKEILDKIQGQKPDPRKEMKRTGHFPTKNESSRARCRFCSLKRVQARTAYKCDTCNISLCLIGCFREYHLMQ